MNLTGILIAGIVIQNIAPSIRAAICGIAAILLGFAIWISKRGSEMPALPSASPAPLPPR